MTYQYDPEFTDLVAMLPASSMADPQAARAGMKDMLDAFNADIDTSDLMVEERMIPGYGAAPEVKIRSYSPKFGTGAETQTPVPGLLFIHGGGFIVGDLDTEHSSSVAIARQLGIVVISVDYRLAPENPFPAGLEDCYATLQWMHTNAAQLGVDGHRIGVFGQSAGGGLAAALALMSRDNGGPPICFQYLGMPELDDRLQTTSMREFDDTPLWNRPNAILSWQFYLGADYQPGDDHVPAYAAPARAEDVHGLPPAYISAMEFDPLRDEDVLYALKLMEAGVPVELHTFPGTFHGSSLFTHAAVSQRQQQEMMDVLRRGLKLEQHASNTSE